MKCNIYKTIQLRNTARFEITPDIPGSYFAAYTHNPMEEWTEMSLK
jgi:hypothetical protein